MTNWRDEFEHKFGAFALIGSAGRFYNGAFANEARVKDAIAFIQSILDQKAKEIEAMKDLKQQSDRWRYSSGEVVVYNQALDDALTILKGEEV